MMQSLCEQVYACMPVYTEPLMWLISQGNSPLLSSELGAVS